MCCTFTGGDGKDVYPDGKYDISAADGTSSMRWGFRSGKRLIVNARAEMLIYKFGGAFANGRCVLNVRGFYEWSAQKQKFYYTSDGGEILLCGLWRNEHEYDDARLFQPSFLDDGEDGADRNGARRFTVITTAANASVASVHDRMPLMVSRDNAEDWIHDGAFARRLLSSEMPMLHCRGCRTSAT